MRPYFNSYNALQNLFNEFMHIDNEHLTYAQLNAHQKCAKEMIELIEMFHADYGNIISSTAIEDTFEEQLKVVMEMFYRFNDVALVQDPNEEDGDWRIDINFTPKYRKVIERISTLFLVFENCEQRWTFMTLVEVL